MSVFSGGKKLYLKRKVSLHSTSTDIKNILLKYYTERGVNVS